jgi:hypothetical protein
MDFFLSAEESIESTSTGLESLLLVDKRAAFGILPTDLLYLPNPVRSCCKCKEPIRKHPMLNAWSSFGLTLMRIMFRKLCDDVGCDDSVY